MSTALIPSRSPRSLRPMPSHSHRGLQRVLAPRPLPCALLRAPTKSRSEHPFLLLPKDCAREDHLHLTQFPVVRHDDVSVTPLSISAWNLDRRMVNRTGSLHPRVVRLPVAGPYRPFPDRCRNNSPKFRTVRLANDPVTQAPRTSAEGVGHKQISLKASTSDPRGPRARTSGQISASRAVRVNRSSLIIGAWSHEKHRAESHFATRREAYNLGVQLV